MYSFRQPNWIAIPYLAISRIGSCMRIGYQGRQIRVVQRSGTEVAGTDCLVSHMPGVWGKGETIGFWKNERSEVSRPVGPLDRVFTKGRLNARHKSINGGGGNGRRIQPFAGIISVKIFHSAAGAASGTKGQVFLWNRCTALIPDLALHGLEKAAAAGKERERMKTRDGSESQDSCFPAPATSQSR